MAGVEAKYVPMRALGEKGDAAEGIVIEENVLTQLYDVGDDLALNVPKLYRMMDIAGINSLRVIDESYHYDFSGNVLEQPREYRQFSNEPVRIYEADFPTQAKSVNTTVFLDIQNMREAIARSPFSYGADPREVWANRLDSALIDGVVAAGRQNLTRGVPRSEKVDAWVESVIGVEVSIPISQATEIFSPFTVFATTSVIHAGYNMSDYNRYRKKRQPGDTFRGSLFNGPQRDRSLWLQVHGAMGRTVKAVKPHR